MTDIKAVRAIAKDVVQYATNQRASDIRLSLRLTSLHPNQRVRMHAYLLRKYKIKITPEKIKSLETVEGLARYLLQRFANQRPATNKRAAPLLKKFEKLHAKIESEPLDPDVWFEMGRYIDDVDLDEERRISHSEYLSSKKGLTRKNFNQISCYKRALELNPKHVKSLVQLGRMNHFYLHDDKEARKYLLKATKVEPRNYLAFYLLAETYNDNGSRQSQTMALRYYEKALHIDPEKAKRHGVDEKIRDLRIMRAKGVR